MEAFLISTGLVAIAEIGDKTMLLAIVLAARFRKPWPILAGILVATLANHGLAATLGSFAGHVLHGPWVHRVLGALFLAFGAWALIPDRFEDSEAPSAVRAGSVFLTTLVAFFFVEMGDKTQIATIALAARFNSILLVAAGTTVGMMLANGPAVWLGEKAATRLPMRYIRWTAAAAFVAIGLWILIAGE